MFEVYLANTNPGGVMFGISIAPMDFGSRMWPLGDLHSQSTEQGCDTMTPDRRIQSI
jgi:hypothetical protein